MQESKLTNYQRMKATKAARKIPTPLGRKTAMANPRINPHATARR